MKSHQRHYSRHITAMLAASLWFCAACGRAAPALVCAQTEFHFPPTPNTEVIEHVFTLRNEGMDPLEIRRLHSDCGCLLARPDALTIAPGAGVDLRARLVLKGRRGMQRRRIVVETNDPRNRRLTLFMIGEAVAEAALDPERLFFGNVRLTAIEARDVLIEFQGAADYRVTAITLDRPDFEAEVEPLIFGERYRLVLRTAPPLTAGRFQFPVAVHTDHPRYPVLNLNVSGRAVGALFAVPDEILLDAAVKRPTGALLMVRSADGGRFNVLDVIVPMPGITAQHRAMAGGDVRMQLRELRAVPELDGASIRILTDHAELPELIVPIRVR